MKTSSSVSPLGQTTANFATDFWNDSCSVDELNYAIASGGVGATTNPNITATNLESKIEALDEEQKVALKKALGIEA